MWIVFDKVLRFDKSPHQENHFIRKFVQEMDFILNNFSLKNRRNYQPFFNLNYKIIFKDKIISSLIPHLIFLIFIY